MAANPTKFCVLLPTCNSVVIKWAVLMASALGLKYSWVLPTGWLLLTLVVWGKVCLMPHPVWGSASFSCPGCSGPCSGMNFCIPLKFMSWDLTLKVRVWGGGALRGNSIRCWGRGLMSEISVLIKEPIDMPCLLDMWRGLNWEGNLRAALRRPPVPWPWISQPP